VNVLLLGATGMLGTAFARKFAAKDIPFTPINHQMMQIESEKSVASIFAAYPADVVINCMGIVSINPCEEDPELCTKVNALGTLYVSRQASARNMVMIQFSSHAVFDGEKNSCYTEDDIPRPKSVYAVSKYSCEVYASMCPKHYVMRVPVMFGPRRNNRLGFVDKMLALMEQGRELRIADDKIDSPTYSLDVAETAITLLTQKAPYGLYHAVNDGFTSYYDFITSVRDIVGLQVLIHRAKDADFPSLVPKPLRTAMRSVKLPTLRGWRGALTEYLQSRAQDSCKDW
jgi:dTDP-4-dehydrorhamnose reductase